MHQTREVKIYAQECMKQFSEISHIVRFAYNKK